MTELQKKPDPKKIPMLDVEPKMILELASGIRDGVDIAEDYGYSADQWEALQKYDPFIRLVEDKKTELKASGYTFRLKSAMIAEELLADVYLASQEEGASFHTKLESLKFTARAAGLDAPAKDLSQTGTGFSITINLAGGKTIQIGGNTGNTTEYDEEYDFDTPICFPDYTPVPFEEENT